MPSGVSFSGGPLEVIDDGASEGCPSDAVMTSPDGREECRWLSSRRRGRFVYVNTEGVTEVCDLRALGWMVVCQRWKELGVRQEAGRVLLLKSDL